MARENGISVDGQVIAVSDELYLLRYFHRNSIDSIRKWLSKSILLKRFRGFNIHTNGEFVEGLSGIVPCYP